MAGYELLIILARFTNLKGDFIKAKDYYSKSLDINYQINSQKGISINFNALGKIELYLGNPLKAQDYFTKALVIDKDSTIKSL